MCSKLLHLWSFKIVYLCIVPNSPPSPIEDETTTSKGNEEINI